MPTANKTTSASQANAPAEPGTDRRIVRTRQAIRAALIELLESKGFEALTVTDLTSLADINRGTFYLHYRDKFDLLEQTEIEIISRLEKFFLQANTLELADFDVTNQPSPVIASMFEYLQQNAALMNAIFGLKGNVAFQAKIRTSLESSLRDGFLARIKDFSTTVPRDYLITYVLSAHIGVIQTWLKKGCLESPHEMARILSTLSFHGPARAISAGPPAAG